MHKEILSDTQIDLFHLLRAARKRSFYMVWGTAISLHLWHRKSIDFDLFRATKFRSNIIQSTLDDAKVRWQTLYVAEEWQYHGMIGWVQTTFFYYPYPIEATVEVKDAIKIPDLLSLAAMKAFAMGRRAKWKDYVDLYFIIRDHYTIDTISRHAEKIFGSLFQSAQFVEQLAYHDDINYTERVEYLIPDPPSDAEVKSFLLARAIEI